VTLGPWYMRAPVPPYVVIPHNLTPHRFIRWSGADPVPATPSAGQDVDAVAGYANDSGVANAAFFPIPGAPIVVESGGAFSNGANLATDAQGRAVAAGAGPVVVARALQAATGAGQIV